MVQLTDRLVHDLDELARRRGESRSALIRQAVAEFIKADAQTRIGTQIVAGYRRIPAATPDEWGDLARHADAATAELARQLDAEERREGNPSW